MSESDYSKFTAPKGNEEIHQGMEVPVTFSIDPNDRMPVPASPDNEDHPPALAVDTLVCMEDKRSFVIRNSDGSVWVSFEASEVSRLPNGEYFVGEDLLTERSKNAFALAFAGDLGGTVQTRLPHDTGLRHVALVEPIRPACQHYARIQMDVSADRNRRYLSRACMAQRSETGEYYSVGDAAIFACSLRSPRHLESEKILDDFDALKVQQANEQARAGAFNVDAALAEESSGSLGVLGSK